MLNCSMLELQILAKIKHNVTSVFDMAPVLYLFVGTLV